MTQPQLSHSYLIFTLAGKHYGVDARLVTEIVRLPQITPLEGLPAFVVGVFNLRGRVVPVVDLHIRMGCFGARYQLTDSILVLGGEGASRLGMVIEEILDVLKVTDLQIEAVPDFGDFDHVRIPRFLTGVVKGESGLIMLLDPDRLLRLVPGSSGVESEIEEKREEEDIETLHSPRLFLPDATEEESKIFRLRAERLRVPQSIVDLTGTASLAVVVLHGELLGVNLEVVRGFAHFRQVTPIPCCPGHIVGAMNLRGEIITLLDLSGLLGIPPLIDHSPDQVLVAQVGNMVVGVLIHEILDVVGLTELELVRLPAASGTVRKDYFRGGMRYGERMCSVLDLSRVLESEEVIVDEQV
ncbi:MAG: chemotaxis protein CheW [Magnetococcus sp. DMHC-6]